MPRSFLSARWQNLILANYRTPRELLQPRLPPGCELDTFDGSCWVSLVGFQFLDTRVLGISWPGYRHFPEWNLRFYVRHDGQRGVVFIREFVPQRLVATVAWLTFNEPYRSARMSMNIDQSETTISATYTVDWGEKQHRMKATGQGAPFEPDPMSPEHWFKEHSWGYGISKWGRRLQYQVSHPRWRVYPFISHEIDVDWAALYGSEWAEMTGRTPDSCMLVEGSAVTVSPWSY